MGTFIITLFLAEIFFIYPNPNFSEIQEDKDSVIIENESYYDNANKLLANFPCAFTENWGQLESEEVRFYAQDGGVWFTDDGVWFEVREELSVNSRRSTVYSPESRLTTDDWPPIAREYKRVILKQEFIGASVVRPTGRQKLSWNSNFLYGNDSSKWCTGVPNYKEICYKNLYDGIDLRYYINKKGLKYDFIVHPGAEVGQIRIRFEGANSLKIDPSGNLKIHTMLGDIVDSNLFIYQANKIEINEIDGKFKKINSTIYSFEITGNFNEKNDLIIDPLLYSTYIGGLATDWGLGIDIDPNNNTYVTGFTGSNNFPNTTGAFNNNLSGNTDIYVFKLNQTGTSLLYSTYIGGNNDDTGWDISVDSVGNAYITGKTNSMNFPSTNGSFNNTLSGNYDAFAIKLNSSGSSLIFSTYLGGNNFDEGMGIKIDSNSNVYITGRTKSKNFPTTLNANDTTYNGNYDIFVLKLSFNGSTLIYSTFIGGSNIDQGYDIAVNSIGNAYVTGNTTSANFPITSGAFDTINNNSDAFVIKLNINGSQLIYSTYLGGSSLDFGEAITIDLKGNAYVTGSTNSTDFPTTPSAYNTTNKNDFDIFISKLNSSGKSLIFSTYVGGDFSNDVAPDITLDSSFNVYVTGVTYSSDFPTTKNAYDKTFNGLSDIFILILNSTGSYLNYSTYLGKDGYDEGLGIVLDFNHNIYVTGLTTSTKFPITTGTYDTSFNGGFDTYVFKLGPAPINNSIPSVLDLKVSDDCVLRTNEVYLFSNGSDVEDIEKNLTPIFEYRDPNGNFWNRTYFYNLKYNNSRWEIIFKPPKDAILGQYDFRVMFNDTYPLFSSWFYLNNFLTVLNNIPLIEDIILSKNKTKLGEKITIWINGTDIEEPEKNLTMELEYRDPNKQYWNSTYISNPIYSNEKWKCVFSIPCNALFGKYDFRARFKDSNDDYSNWLEINDSLLIYNTIPRIIDTKLSENEVFRTNSVFLYVNSTDYETPESLLKFYAQYKLETMEKWIVLTGNYSNDRWDVKFITTINTTLGFYDFRVKFIDNESTTTGWKYLNDSLEVLNNIPYIEDFSPSKSIIFRAETITIYTNASDIEDPENLLTSGIRFKSSSGTWIELGGVFYDIDHWEINFTPSIDAELGFYDIEINFTDLDGDYCGWTIFEDAFEVKNNHPLISELCDDFIVNTSKLDIDLTQYEFDIEDSNEDLIWSVDQTTINKSLFSVGITNYLEDILRIIPMKNKVGSDDITLILGDKDGGVSKKSDITININTLQIVNLSVFPDSIEMKPDQSTKVKLTVINKGSIADIYKINFFSDIFSPIDFQFENNILSIQPGRMKNITVNITTPDYLDIGIYKITFIAKSNYSSDIANLTLNIISIDDRSKEENYNVILLFFILIIIIPALAIFIYKHKKKERKESEPEQAETIKLGELPTAEISIDRAPKPTQPPTISTSESEKKVITPGTSAPELPSPSTESHDATPSIPQMQPKPQLPPAQPQIATPESKDETPTPTQAPSTETSENSTKSEEINEDLPKSQD